MGEPVLAVAERALRAAEAVLQAGIEGNDPALVIGGLREVRGALELVARLRVEAGVAVDAGPVDLDEQIQQLLDGVREHLSPHCPLCGEPCSACTSEVVGMPRPLRAPVGLPAPVDDAVVVPEPAEAQTDAETPRAKPMPKSPAPVSVKPKERGPSWEERFRHARVNDETGNGALWNNRDVW